MAILASLRSGWLPMRRKGPAGALLACALLAGCGPASSGPLINGLNGGVGSGEECITHMRPGGVLSYGFEAFSNRGQAVTVTKADLARPRGLEILQAWMVPITGTYLYGVLHGWPPYKHLPKGVQWSRRQRADGAVIPHSRGHDQMNLVLVLRGVRNVATAAGVNVYYLAAGQDYHLRTHIAIRLLTGSAKCL